MLHSNLLCECLLNLSRTSVPVILNKPMYIYMLCWRTGLPEISQLTILSKIFTPKSTRRSNQPTKPMCWTVQKANACTGNFHPNNVSESNANYPSSYCSPKVPLGESVMRPVGSPLVACAQISSPNARVIALGREAKGSCVHLNSTFVWMQRLQAPALFF